MKINRRLVEQEIHDLQSVDNYISIPKKTFKQLIKNLVKDMHLNEQLQWSSDGLDALQKATEAGLHQHTTHVSCCFSAAGRGP